MPVESSGTTLDALGCALTRDLGPQFWDTIYISEARKIKSDVQVAIS